jgi:hypothetical protein
MIYVIYYADGQKFRSPISGEINYFEDSVMWKWSKDVVLVL